MTKHLKIETDFASVEITPEFRAAIELIRDAAWTLQITSGELMSEFEDGIPSCPNCDD